MGLPNITGVANAVMPVVFPSNTDLKVDFDVKRNIVVITYTEWFNMQKETCRAALAFTSYSIANMMKGYGQGAYEGARISYDSTSECRIDAEFEVPPDRAGTVLGAIIADISIRALAMTGMKLVDAITTYQEKHLKPIISVLDNVKKQLANTVDVTNMMPSASPMNILTKPGLIKLALEYLNVLNKIPSKMEKKTLPEIEQELGPLMKQLQDLSQKIAQELTK